MKGRALSLLLLAALARPAAGAPQERLPPPLAARLRRAIEATMATYSVPGALVGVWVPGKAPWIQRAGVADLAARGPVSDAMSWPLRSVTKSFTVTLALQLVDERRLELSDPVSKWIPGVPNGDRVTLWDLAAMASGVPEYTTRAFLVDFLSNPERLFTLDELNAYALAESARFVPGTRRVYTNTNTNLLGAVVERVTGRSYRELLEERILRPLRLSGTHDLGEGAPWPLPHATGYQPDDGTLEPQLVNFSIFGPAGSLVSTLEDERVWAEALAKGTLLSPETQAARKSAAAPLEEGPEYDAYGLGIGTIAGWWGHTGEGLGFTALAMHDTASGATVVIFMNVAKADPAGHPPTKLFRRIAALLKDGE